MKRMLLISRVVLLAALGVLAISFFVTPLPDWAVRVDGVLVMITIFTMTFATIRLQRMK